MNNKENKRGFLGIIFGYPLILDIPEDTQGRDVIIKQAGRELEEARQALLDKRINNQK